MEAVQTSMSMLAENAMVPLFKEKTRNLIVGFPILGHRVGSRSIA